tara:strand:- start:1316 stop:1855 length:540 start_codon:yes stop_codon:yes gene_type:complete
VNSLNIIIIGYRGTGKGAVGRLLAKKLGRRFLDTDYILEKNAAMDIPTIFEKLGEPKFRDFETEAVKEACSNETPVISTGGGAPMREENAKAMKKNGIVILLECVPEVIYSRIKGDPHRPALTDLNDEFKEIKVMLEKRNPIYHKIADFVTDTSHTEVTENVEEILEFLKKKGIGGKKE